MTRGLRGAALPGAIALAAVAVGAVLRAIPVPGDLWLDEIWTLDLARRLDSPLGVFTSIHHSNNNHLNTLLCYWIGDRGPAWIPRLPALVAGILTVPLAGLVALRWGRLEAAYATVLTAGCYALVHFSSEARGYALAVAFALGAWLALDAALARRRPAAALAFGLCCSLGILSHLVFLFFYAGAALQSGWRLLRPPAPDALPRLAALHALPLATAAALWAVDLRELSVGGGNPTDYAALAAKTVGTALGLPVAKALALPSLAVVAAVLALGLTALRREGDDAWILVAVTVVVAPAVVIGGMRPAVVAVRYFLIGTACFLVLAAFLLARLHRTGPRGRTLCVALVALFTLGNALHVGPFLRHGRGGYSEALAFMARETDAPRIVVGSDHDFRNGLVLRFHARGLPRGTALVYVPKSDWPPGGPEWLVTHRPHRPAATPARIRDRRGNAYRLAADFDHAAISGFYWAVYRNAGASGGGGSPPRSPGP